MKKSLLHLTAIAAILFFTPACKKSAVGTEVNTGSQKPVSAISINKNQKIVQLIQQVPQEDINDSLSLRIRPGLYPGVVNSFTAIGNVAGNYLSETKAIDFSDFGDCTEHDSVSDGNLTVWFSAPMQKFWVLGGPVVDCWYNGQWGFYPDVENTNPHVLFSMGQNSMTLKLSCPVNIFGFELSPNYYDAFNYKVSFYNNSFLVGSITREVLSAEGDLASARLFAAKTRGSFNKIIIELTAGNSLGFSIGQIRYSQLHGRRYKWANEDFRHYWLNKSSYNK